MADELVIALADGAGGTGNGAAAAQAIVDAVAAPNRTAHDWGALVEALDTDLQRLGGQSTTVIISIHRGVLSGCSVGDSGAWLLCGTDSVELTHGQHRKPLVGAGCVPWRIP